MHIAYADVFNENGETVLSRQAFFRQIHKEKTCPYSHHRKTSVTGASTLTKDTCPLKKEQTQHAKSVGKELAVHENVLVTTMGLHALLLSPSSKTAILYYKPKLCCHNRNVNDLAFHKVRNYFRHEPDGGIPAIEFTSCVHHYLTARLQCDKYILYSDGCTYQNRKAILSKTLQKSPWPIRRSLSRNF